MVTISYLAVVLVLVAHLMVEPGKALRCDEHEIQETGTKCNPFTRGDQPEPSGECCDAYRALRARVKTTEERKQYCFCVHEATFQNRFVRGSSSNPASRISRIDVLPEKCGVPFLFSVDPKFDCNT